MAADNLGRKPRKPQVIDGESRVVQGPWDGVPKKKAKPPREPFFKRNLRGPSRRGGREPLINSWRGLVICLFLLFVAPPLAAWGGHFLMHLLFAQ
jgi:hypothetical protein